MPSTIFEKHSILDAWWGSEYAFKTTYEKTLWFIDINVSLSSHEKTFL